MTEAAARGIPALEGATDQVMTAPSKSWKRQAAESFLKSPGRMQPCQFLDL